MLKITIEAIGPNGREEAEHFCLCLGHQDQLVASFLTVLMHVANGAKIATCNGVLAPGEPTLPPRIPGMCRICNRSMPMPADLGICEECRMDISEQQEGTDDYTTPPPALYDPTIGLREPPEVGRCLNCGGSLGNGFMFCAKCTSEAPYVSAG